MAEQNQQLATYPNSTMFDAVSRSGRSYRIRIAHPASAGDRLTPTASGQKPVALYVLDGQESFGIVSDVARALQYGGEIPPCYVVGISYPDEGPRAFTIRRTDELTPTPFDPSWREQRPSGSAPMFLAYLRDELTPQIEASYDVESKNSVLIGHSYGGLFTIFAAIQQAPVFAHHFALSPSLYWDDSIVVKHFEKLLMDPPTGDRGRLFVTIGAEERHISPADCPDLAQRVRMVQHVEKLSELCSEHPEHFSEAEFVVLDGETHNSILGASLIQGLRFLLRP